MDKSFIYALENYLALLLLRYYARCWEPRYEESGSRLSEGQGWVGLNDERRKLG